MNVTPMSSFANTATVKKPNEVAKNATVKKPDEVAKNSSVKISSDITGEESKITVLENNGYEKIKQVGSGTYAKVITAYSAKEKCVVAIKIISKMNTSKTFTTKFLHREVNIVRGLIHPNLIKYYRSIETTHRIYIVMEYAKNGSLLEMIRGETYFTEAKARHVYRQLVDALQYCHNRGVVHRDIKCENILFDENNVLKIIDFGFANSYKSITTALSETYCGSRAYCCPEIIKHKPYQPHSADIWASGVVLFAMVHGKLPFDDSDSRKLLKQQQSKICFPEKPQTSEMCRQLIMAILAPPRRRASWNEIKKFDWMTTEELSDSKLTESVVSVVKLATG